MVLSLQENPSQETDAIARGFATLLTSKMDEETLRKHGGPVRPEEVVPTLLKDSDRKALARIKRRPRMVKIER